MEIIRNEEEENISKGYLALPFDDDQFKKFIIGLLGKPQVLEKRVYGDFEIYLKDIQNFHELIEQRITQQNNGKLVQFKTQIFFSDDSSVSLGSYAELVTYNELRSISTKGILVSWVYLIQFPSKDVPEKQDIDIFISVDDFRNYLSDGIRRDKHYSNNTININIAHTARTWGYDMLQLLHSHAKSLVIKEKPIKLFLRRNSDLISMVFFILFLTGSLFGIYFFSSKLIGENIIEAQEFIKKENDISAKINYLINEFVIQDYIMIKSIVFIVISLILAFIFVMVIEKHIHTSRDSHIILSKFDKLNLSLDKKIVKQGWLYLIGSIILGIFINIVSSFIYDYWI